MRDEKLSVVKAWFKKAENDLINAENTIKMALPLLPIQYAFTRNSARKSISKGFLLSIKLTFRRLILSRILFFCVKTQNQK